MQSNIFSSFFALAIMLAMIPTCPAQSPASPAPLKTLPYNFTLAALNTTLPNVNDTDVLLVITGRGGTGGNVLHHDEIMSDEQMWWIESGDPWNPNIDQFTALHAYTRRLQHTYGHDSLWSLCVLQLGDSNVIYNVSADPSAPIPDKGCHKVILQIIPEHH
ncbi:hypothetical protein K525DRAFT_265648 [Schizophyllum commune Loenen D]|nr:hypothetical protein K525DRAFT_265648 [Schizophyllum commune Loenen D]